MEHKLKIVKKPRKLIRSTPAQLRGLVDYMSKNVLLANGDLKKAQLIKEWEKVKILLRDIGPDKSLVQWQNTWRDLKKKARVDAEIFRKGETNGLSQMTIKILKIIGADDDIVTNQIKTGPDVREGRIPVIPKKSKPIKTTNAQLSHLMKYMAANHPLANEKYCDTRDLLRIQRHWEILQGSLNNLGPKKTVYQWKEIWAGLRNKFWKDGFRITFVKDADNQDVLEESDSSSNDFLRNVLFSSEDGSQEASTAENEMDFQSAENEKNCFMRVLNTKNAKIFVKCTPAQVRALVDYMSLNNEFANDRDTPGTEKQWDELRQILKNYGSDRTVEQWQQTWRALIAQARRVHLKHIKSGNKGPLVVSETLLKVLNIVGEVDADEFNSRSEISIPESNTPNTLIQVTVNGESCDDTEELYSTLNEMQESPQRKPTCNDILNFEVDHLDQSIVNPDMNEEVKLELIDSDSNHSSNNPNSMSDENYLTDYPIKEEAIKSTRNSTDVPNAKEETPIYSAFKYVRNPDEYEAMGITVAAKVRRMETAQKVHAELLIQKVLAKGLLGQLRDSTELIDLKNIRPVTQVLDVTKLAIPSESHVPRVNAPL